MLARVPLRTAVLIAAAVAVATTFTTTARGGEPLTTRAETQAFLEDLRSARERVDQRVAESAARLQAAKAATMAAKERHDQATSNVERLDIATSTLCNTDIAIAILMSSPELKLSEIRGRFKGWVEKALNVLEPETVGNVYLWYQRYDFRAPLETYQALETNLAERLPGVVSSACAELQSSVFGELRQLASRLDDINREGREKAARLNAGGLSDAARSALKNELSALKEEAARLDQQRDQLLAQGQQRKSRAMDELQFEVRTQVADLESLEIPERGKITGQRPKKVSFANRTRFGVHFLGRHIPTGLSVDDIGVPNGLRVLTVSGGNDDLYIYFEKSDALEAGQHEIDIAGEKVSFRFENEASNESANPLVAEGDNQPAPTANDGTIPEDGKGTLLTPQVLSDHTQLQWGYWQYTREHRDPDDSEKESTLRVAQFRHTDEKLYTVILGLGREPYRHDDLVPHERVTVQSIWEKGVLGQYDGAGPQCLTGLRSIKEHDDLEGNEQCPQWRWWAPSKMCFGPNNLSLREDVDSKKHDPESCESQDQHQAIEVEYERFVGLTFAPIATGKYIHTVTVGAPFQYVAEIKLTWDYEILEPGRLQFLVRAMKGQLPGEVITTKSDIQATGEYLFSTQKPGQFMFEMQVYDSQDNLIHKDFAAAYLDR